nr:hypothetical protein GCM10020093_072860 [Planobispora longispora]
MAGAQAVRFGPVEERITAMATADAAPDQADATEIRVFLCKDDDHYQQQCGDTGATEAEKGRSGGRSKGCRE